MMFTPRSWITVLLGLLLTAGPLGSQERKAPNLPLRGQTFGERVDVHLVEIGFLATDRRGRPVTDLVADELVVKENGQIQGIALFEHHGSVHDLGAGSPKTASAARIHFHGPDGRRPQPRTGAEPRWLVFLFDLVHGDLPTLAEAGDAARAFLLRGLSPGDRLAIAVFDGSVHLVENFTDDPAGLQKALDRTFARPARALPYEVRMRELLTLLRSCQKQMIFQEQFRTGQECFAAAGRNYVNEIRRISEDYLGAIDSLARLLAGVEGEKALLLFSHGVALDPGWEAVEAMEAIAGNNQQIQALRYELTHGHESGARRDFAAAVEQALRSGVRVFALDATAPPTGDFGLAERVRLRATARPFTVAYDQARDSLAELSASTGGKFFGRGEVLVNLDGALDAARGAYTVAYYRDLARIEDPGAFFKTRISCRRKGVKISSRKGYYLEPAARATQLGRLELAAPEARNGATLVPFAITVQPLAFDLVRGEHEVGVHFTLFLALSTRDGTAIADSFHFLSHAFARAAWEGGKVVAPRYEGFLELPPGEYLFSATLRDPRRATYSEWREEIHAPAGTP